MPIRSLTREHVEDWLERLEDKELGEQTIRNCRNVLSVICEYAVKKRLVKTNPARGSRRDAAKRTEDPWTYAILEEQARPIEEAAKDGLDCLIEFAMGSGLREGEQCMLHLCDVQLDDPDPHLWVRYGGLPTAKHPRGQPPKSGRIRRIQLFGLAKRALERWIPQLPKFCPDNPHGLVFPRKRGGYRDPDHIIRWEEWKGRDEHRTPKRGNLVPRKAGILERAGIFRDFRWHDLRHTCGSSLVSGWWGRRWALQEVRDFLGHKEIKTTERYAQLGETAAKQAAREAEAMFRSVFHGVPQSHATKPKSPMIPMAPPTRVERATNGLGSLCEVPVNSACYEADGRNVALSLLRAVEEGRGEDADRFASELASLVLNEDRVALALAVRGGGPLRITRAIRLAEDTLTDLEGASAEDLAGAGKGGT